MAKQKQHRILISRPDRIGDVVLSTPIPREIKKTYPGSFVAMLVRSYTKEIFLNNPHVDEIILADEILNGSKVNVLNWAKRIRKYKFTHALMLLPNERINYLLFLAGIKTRVGVGYKFYQFITGVKSVSRKKYIPLRHEADYCMDLARRIGVKTDNLKPEIFLTDEEKEESAKIKKKLLGDKKFLVGIHTSSGKSAPNWTTESYVQLIDELNKIPEIKIIVTDNEKPKDLNTNSEFEFPNLNQSLRESIITFSSLDLLVSASTGPMHICSALEVKTLAMFCPLNVLSPKLWGPLGNESTEILPSENYCQIKCPGDPKKCTFEGEGGISVGKVKSEVLKLLKIS